MKPLLDIVLPASSAHIEQIRDAAVAVAREMGFSAEQVARVELVVEEAVTNVILHAYPEGGGKVALSCGCDDGGNLAVTVADNGVAFDPTAPPGTHQELPPGQRITGGLGIDLLRHNADRLAYRRTKDKNILEMMFTPERGDHDA